MIAGIIIGSIVGAFCLVMCIPFYGSFEFQAEDKVRFRLRLRWLFGAFKREFPAQRAERKRGISPQNIDAKSRRGGRWRKLMGYILTDDESRKRSVRLLKSVIRSAQIDRLEADLRLGLCDPADTTIVFGPLGAASIMFNLYSDHIIWLLPDFQGENIEGYIKARIRLLPIRLFRSVMDLITSRTGRSMVKKVLSPR